MRRDSGLGSRSDGAIVLSVDKGTFDPVEAVMAAEARSAWSDAMTLDCSCVRYEKRKSALSRT